MSTASILAESAVPAHLLDVATPFARQGSLRDRLAANPFLMAPMAGVSDAAYRIMARAGGAATAYSEMVSVAGIHYGGDKTWELVDPDEAEPNLAVQLFGRDPELFREAVSRVQDRLGPKLALIDVNMACPVPKVCRKGEGSALLDEPDVASAVVGACVAETSLPVTVKMRIGRRPDHIVGPEFARAMEQAGACAVAVHGRTASQLYHGTADRAAIADVVRSVSVPVIASGDVLTADAACSMLRETGAAGAFVARGTYGNPWIFSDALALREGDRAVTHGADQHLEAFRCHVRLLDATHAHMARARSLAGWYFKGLPHASRWRDRAMRCVTLQDFLDLVDEVEEDERAVRCGEILP